MWKAIVLASGLILAAASSQATPPMHAPSPTAAVFTHGAPSVDTVQYRHDRGNHYGWYKQRRHYGWNRPYRHHGWYKPHRPYRQHYRPHHRRYW